MVWCGMYRLEKSGDDDLVRKKEGRLQSIAFYMQKAFFKSRKKIVEVGQGSLVSCIGDYGQIRSNLSQLTFNSLPSVDS